MTLSSPVVLITGATGGIGQAIAHTFAKRGYRLALTGRDPEKLGSLADLLDVDTDKLLIIKADLTQHIERDQLIAKIVDAFGRIDVLINNAGVFSAKPFLDVDEAHLDLFLETNLKATYFLTQTVVPHMLRAGGGSILNVGTVLVDHALVGFPASAPVVSKGALHALTRQLAAEFGKDNIRINTLAPGIIRTPLHAKHGVDPDTLKHLHLLHRIGEASEAAQAAYMLAESTFITGSMLPVDGGHIAGHMISAH